jgi:hypothetical protein
VPWDCSAQLLLILMVKGGHSSFRDQENVRKKGKFINPHRRGKDRLSPVLPGYKDGEMGAFIFSGLFEIPFSFSHHTDQFSTANLGTAARSLSAETTVQLPSIRAMAAICISIC